MIHNKEIIKKSRKALRTVGHNEMDEHLDSIFPFDYKKTKQSSVFKTPDKGMPSNTNHDSFYENLKFTLPTKNIEFESKSQALLEKDCGAVSSCPFYFEKSSNERGESLFLKESLSICSTDMFTDKSEKLKAEVADRNCYSSTIFSKAKISYPSLFFLKPTTNKFESQTFHKNLNFQTEDVKIAKEVVTESSTEDILFISERAIDEHRKKRVSQAEFHQNDRDIFIANEKEKFSKSHDASELCSSTLKLSMPCESCITSSSITKELRNLQFELPISNSFKQSENINDSNRQQNDSTLDNQRKAALQPFSEMGGDRLKEFTNMDWEMPQIAKIHSCSFEESQSKNLPNISFLCSNLSMSAKDPSDNMPFHRQDDEHDPSQTTVASYLTPPSSPHSSCLSSSPSTNSLDSHLISNFQTWEPSLIQKGGFVSDVDFIVRGERKSIISRIVEMEIRKRWERQDIKWKREWEGRRSREGGGENEKANVDVDFGDDIIKTKDEQKEKDSVKIEEEEDDEGKNAERKQRNLLKKRKKVVKEQIREAEYFFRTFKKWLRKDWECSQTENKMWVEAELAALKNSEPSETHQERNEAELTKEEMMCKMKELENGEVLEMSKEEMEELLNKQREEEEFATIQKMSDLERFFREKAKIREKEQRKAEKIIKSTETKFEEKGIYKMSDVNAYNEEKDDRRRSERSKENDQLLEEKGDIIELALSTGLDERNSNNSLTDACSQDQLPSLQWSVTSEKGRLKKEEGIKADANAKRLISASNKYSLINPSSLVSLGVLQTQSPYCFKRYDKILSQPSISFYEGLPSSLLYVSGENGMFANRACTAKSDLKEKAKMMMRAIQPFNNDIFKQCKVSVDDPTNIKGHMQHCNIRDFYELKYSFPQDSFDFYLQNKEIDEELPKLAFKKFDENERKVKNVKYLPNIEVLIYPILADADKNFVSPSQSWIISHFINKYESSSSSDGEFNELSGKAVIEHGYGEKEQLGKEMPHKSYFKRKELQFYDCDCRSYNHDEFQDLEAHEKSRNSKYRNEFMYRYSLYTKRIKMQKQEEIRAFRSLLFKRDVLKTPPQRKFLWSFDEFSVNTKKEWRNWFYGKMNNGKKCKV
ncbi:uncharacterized protein MONOS_1619 [Monocercomonoides exilis]|uniref:uncharacterized protein n=1 Tax=Monocercomonoides exilis TaxID=2049356 RepID=UPI003559A390|nr:hypothetical protein MONOS_1619 [Monocercomonoides exilis]|eukprot:MONOS_1619.1-p1 / transcript=MONOS_1619.1 / gene=MONOS_1619 / organism=Monocercomonoides_exilis_PA203 / gene_product=unspecified product / transcript_product=unspecified product / location=Mono_scaffold00029:144847-148264(-) / protein_length=1105 / sequence_SO=supercontig / SO=protein_coding / is_pseudo=false